MRRARSRSQPMEVAGIVLAAGRSARMGGANKLLLPWSDGCVLRAVAAKMVQAELSELVVVSGHEPEKIAAAVAGLRLRVVHNPRYGEGMATSIAAGVEATGAVGGYLLALGDMPRVRAATMRAVRQALADERGIALPVAGGRRGHPVAIGAAYRGELLALKGEGGARPVVQAHAEQVVEVEVDDAGILLDVDTPASYRAALKGCGLIAGGRGWSPGAGAGGRPGGR